MTLIYKICSQEMWNTAQATGIFPGASVDMLDGYIHFSTAEQARETAAKHFAGARDLVLVAVQDEAFGALLHYEPSRGGALFPHLYGEWAVGNIAWVKTLPLGEDGIHIFPPDFL
jgi:uncharacterized protein (DUF952 family)